MPAVSYRFAPQSDFMEPQFAACAGQGAPFGLNFTITPFTGVASQLIPVMRLFPSRKPSAA